MSIERIQSILDTIQPISPSVKGAEVQKKGETSFSEMFSNAVKEVDTLQNQADKKIEDLVLKRDDTSTHDAMIALEKADTAFQLMNSIRSKIIRAYEDVIRTQV